MAGYFTTGVNKANDTASGFWCLFLIFSSMLFSTFDKFVVEPCRLMFSLTFRKGLFWKGVFSIGLVYSQ